jgi:DNA polymerase-3 subunit chi
VGQINFPQVDFYILPENGNQKHFACALIQKAWKQGNNIFVNTRSGSEAAAFDDLLWTFKDISFLPHCLATNDNTENSPIVIGDDNHMHGQIPDHTTIMLNLTDQMPRHTNKLKRILEIVAGSESERQQARKRYAEYRDQGHELINHKIESSDG